MFPARASPAERDTQRFRRQQRDHQSNLKAFTSTTYEGGIELQLLKNRLGLDFAYYDRKTTNDIVNTAISTTSVMASSILNIGELDNRGVRAIAHCTPSEEVNLAGTSALTQHTMQ